MQSAAERIRQFRLLAQKLRGAGVDLKTNIAIASFAQIAESYDAMADRLQALEPQDIAERAVEI
jgi:hypothetical protein